MDKLIKRKTKKRSLASVVGGRGAGSGDGGDASMFSKKLAAELSKTIGVIAMPNELPSALQKRKPQKAGDRNL